MSGSSEEEHERAGVSREEALSVLEEALRRALATVPPEQVLQRLTTVFPGFPAEIDAGAESRFHGRVRKVSVSMPEELTAAVRARTGPGAFSRYVTEAVGTQLRHDLMGEYLDELEAKYGPVPEELLEQARREWPDYEGE
jgi:hypothetical protein